MQGWITYRERAAEIGGIAHLNGITMDYHDLRMSELEQAAEESLKNALVALDRGESAAASEVERWAITLDNIRQMKTAVAQTCVRPFSG
jgi:hypothetical protein